MHTCAIDIHHHYMPPGLIEELKAHGKAVGTEVGSTPEGLNTVTIGGGPSFVVPPPLMDVEKRLANMDKGKIAMATLEPHTACLGYRLNPEQGETWCNLYNEGLMELRTRHPDRFTALAAVPLQDPARAARVLERGILEQKLAGAYIGTNVNGEYFRSHEYDAFWGKAQELDALIVMHPEDIAGLERMGTYGLFLICGNPADTALSLGFMTYSGVFDRFPRLEALHPPRRRFLSLSPGTLRPGLRRAARGGGRRGPGEAQRVPEKPLLRRAGVPGGHAGVPQEPAGVGAPDGRDRLPLSAG